MRASKISKYPSIKNYITDANELENKLSLVIEVNVPEFKFKKLNPVAKINEPLIPNEVIVPDINETTPYLMAILLSTFSDDLNS